MSIALPDLLARLRVLEDQCVSQCELTTRMLTAQRRRLSMVRQAIAAAQLGHKSAAFEYLRLAKAEGRE